MEIQSMLWTVKSPEDWNTESLIFTLIPSQDVKTVPSQMMLKAMTMNPEIFDLFDETITIDLLCNKS